MSEIRVNTFKAEDGISAPSFPNGIQVTGIVTSTVLDASVSTLNVTGGHINVGSNIQLGDAGILTATTFKGNIEGTTGTFLGNVSIGGTLTYEDVSNIDAVGLITARNGVSISSGGLKVLGGGSNFNANITGTATTALSVTAADESSDTSCNVLFATAATGNVAPKTGTNLTFNSSNGTLTATSFAGSGSGITGVPAANLTGTAAAINGSNITALNAGNVSSGTLPITRGGTGLTSLGAANKALKVNNAGNALEFGDAGAWTKIASGSGPGSTSIIIDNIFSDTYDYYKLFYTWAQDDWMKLQYVKADGTVQTGGAYTWTGVYSHENTDGTGRYGNNAQTFGSYSYWNATDDSPAVVEITYYHPYKSSYKTTDFYNCTIIEGSRLYYHGGSNFYNATESHRGVKMFGAGGDNISAANFKYLVLGIAL